MHLAPLIKDLTVILPVASLASFVCHRLRQPIVVGYILAGLLVGPASPLISLTTDVPNIRVWAELGVAFLLFTLGLDFNFRRLAALGAQILITGAFEMTCLLCTGYLLGRVLDWDRTSSLFLGATLAISSTTIIYKAFESLGLKRRRFAEMVFGVLIIEDLFAILILVALSSLFSRSANLTNLATLELASALVRLIAVVSTLVVTGFLMVPPCLRIAGRVGSDELLTISSLGFCLTFVAIAAHFGYSTALGAFLMGAIIAETPEARRIRELMLPLRDLFAAVFFVSIGILFQPATLYQHMGLVGIIALTLISGKFLFVSLGFLLIGQPLRLAIPAALSMTQIGEFSFIIATLEQSDDSSARPFAAIIVLVSLMTTLTTPFLIRSSDKITAFVERHLPGQMRRGLELYSTQVQLRAKWRPELRSLFSLIRRQVARGLPIVTNSPHAKKAAAMERLAPWEAHLVQLDTHPDSEIVGHSLAEIRLRERFGLNIVAIQRGSRIIVAPNRDEHIFPKDELLVLANDEQVDSARELIEGYAVTPTLSHDLADFEMWPLTISTQSFLTRKSIFASGLRERFGVLAVGLEREGRRFINPPSQLILETGDRLWVVGDRGRLRDLETQV